MAPKATPPSEWAEDPRPDATLGPDRETVAVQHDPQQEAQGGEPQRVEPLPTTSRLVEEQVGADPDRRTGCNRHDDREDRAADLVGQDRQHECRDERAHDAAPTRPRLLLQPGLAFSGHRRRCVGVLAVERIERVGAASSDGLHLSYPPCRSPKDVGALTP